jgi:hypothetical protein
MQSWWSKKARQRAFTIPEERAFGVLVGLLRIGTVKFMLRPREFQGAKSKSQKLQPSQPERRRVFRGSGKLRHFRPTAELKV